MKYLSLFTLCLAGVLQAAVPGRIEAEAWSAFQDNASTPGTQACDDAGGGLNVGWIDAGEWLAYDVAIPTAGDYRLTIRAASAVGGTKVTKLEVDGVATDGVVSFTHTDGWQTWHSVGFAPLPLTAGTHRLKLVFETGNMNLNWLELVSYVPQQLAAPSQFELTAADTGSATFKWQDGFDDETGYKLYVSTDAQKPAVPSLTVGPNTATAVVPGLQPGLAHHAWLEAVNAAGSGLAAELDFTTLTEALPAAVSVGAGSYAAYPPYQEGGTPGFFQNYALNPPNHLSPDEARAVPTNDWWTDLLQNRFNSTLWSYPHTTRTTAEGFRVAHPRNFNASGSQIQQGAAIIVGGNAFIASGARPQDWSDWGVKARMEGGPGQWIDATLAHGVPFTWFEFTGTTPQIRFSNAATLRTAAGAVASFPLTTSALLVEMDGGRFGLHFPPGTTVTQSAGVLAFNGSLLSISALPAGASLAEFDEVAFNIPRSTKVEWAFDPEAATLATTWSVVTENPTGAPAGDTFQGFLPHHLRGTLSRDFELTPHAYVTTRGSMKLARGKHFSMSYRWHGLLPHYPAPSDLTGSTPYRPEVMNRIITEYAAEANYGTDTYWGGKGLVNLGKYMLFARELNHPAYPAIKAKLKQALADWLTYTPGETSRYYAAYPGWKALVGFDESYYSYQFTDHHFHYGYLIHAAALMAMDDPQWLAPYADMLRMVAKEYANWDRDDGGFPFMRTFDPWIGHSYAGGTGSPGGNNQESTSEAIQSWAGLFFLGSLLEDDAMRDAGAFGYQAEANATMEYWFNRSGDNWPAAYKATHDVVGILWNDGFSYGTFFSAAPHHIYGIQWLPVCPAFKHVVDGVTPQWSEDLYQGLMDRVLEDHEGKPEAADGVVTEPEIGVDWANVLLGYRMFSDPGYVTGKMEQWKDSSNNAERQTVFSDVGGLTYYYSHAHQSWGEIDWEVTMSIPTSTAFKHPVSGEMTYVVFNPKAQEQVCEVRRNGSVVGSFRVPALKTVAHHLDGALTSIVVSAPQKHLVPGASMTVSVAGFDQYGATWDLDALALSTTKGGVIHPDGRFTALAKTELVTITATQGNVSGSFALRIGDPLVLAGVTIGPEFVRVPVGGSASFTARAYDQYGDELPAGSVVWGSDGGSVSASGVFTAPTSPGVATLTASAGGRSATAFASVHQPLQNLALGKQAVATNSLGGNTAAKAVDGLPGTRWETAHGIDNQSIQVDLGAVYDLTRVVLRWETAAAKSYTIDVSLDGASWQTVYGDEQGNAGVDEIPLQATARHVRMSGITRTTGYGFSLWEMEVYGHPAVSTLVPASLGITPPTWSLAPGETRAFRAFAFNAAGQGGEVQASWTADRGGVSSAGVLTAPASAGPVMLGASYGGLNQVATVNVVVAPATAYQAWRSARFTEGSADGGVEADPDGDGLVNLLEFYHGGDPLSGLRDPLLEVTRGSGFAELRFTRSAAAVGEWSLRVEGSGDLYAWAEMVPSQIQVTPLVGGLEEVVLRVPVEEGDRYFRLRVTE